MTEEYILLWFEQPLLSIFIFFLLAYVSMVVHELGHAVAAQAVGAKVTVLKFGKPSLKSPYMFFNVELYFGLPLGGSCHYIWITVDGSTPWRSAFVRIGGWLADVALLTFVVASGQREVSSTVYMLSVYLWIKIVFGLTPITKDGRNLINDVKLGLSNPHFWNKQ